MNEPKPDTAADDTVTNLRRRVAELERPVAVTGTGPVRSIVSSGEQEP